SNSPARSPYSCPEYRSDGRGDLPNGHYPYADTAARLRSPQGYVPSLTYPVANSRYWPHPLDHQSLPAHRDRELRARARAFDIDSDAVAAFGKIQSKKTIDQHIADQVAGDTPLWSIEVGTEDMGTAVGACDGF